MSAPLSEQQLAEIRTRLERARTTAGLGLWADGEYETIVAALADVPALLAEVKRLREQVADLEVERAKLVRWHEEDARQLRRWGLRVAKTQQQVKDAQSRVTELEQQLATAVEHRDYWHTELTHADARIAELGRKVADAEGGAR